MRRFLLGGVSLMLLVGGSACAKERKVDPLGSSLVDGPGYHGVLLDARLDWMQDADGTVYQGDEIDSFVPDAADVDRFEGQLDEALDDAVNPSGEPVTPADLADYARQYTGLEAGDTRQLAVSAICDSQLDSFPEWTDRWVVVADGGSCFWEATMDLATGEILRFAFNGSA